MKKRFFLAAAIAVLLISACADKKVYLFNGENLDGWKTVLRDDPDAITGPSTFSAKDGVIYITGNPFGYIRTEKVFSNYKLHLEWRWAGEESADGGVFHFLQGADKVWPQGIQFQMTSKDMGFLMGGSLSKVWKVLHSTGRPGLSKKARKNLSGNGMTWISNARAES